jgi:hypothetical protein
VDQRIEPFLGDVLALAGEGSAPAMQMAAATAATVFVLICCIFGQTRAYANSNLYEVSGSRIVVFLRRPGCQGAEFLRDG